MNLSKKIYCVALGCFLYLTLLCLPESVVADDVNSEMEKRFQVLKELCEETKKYRKTIISDLDRTITLYKKQEENYRTWQSLFVAFMKKELESKTMRLVIVTRGTTWKTDGFFNEKCPLPDVLVYCPSKKNAIDFDFYDFTGKRIKDSSNSSPDQEAVCGELPGFDFQEYSKKQELIDKNLLKLYKGEKGDVLKILKNYMVFDDSLINIKITAGDAKDDFSMMVGEENFTIDYAIVTEAHSGKYLETIIDFNKSNETGFGADQVQNGLRMMPDLKIPKQTPKLFYPNDEQSQKKEVALKGFLLGLEKVLEELKQR